MEGSISQTPNVSPACHAEEAPDEASGEGQRTFGHHGGPTPQTHVSYMAWLRAVDRLMPNVVYMHLFVISSTNRIGGSRYEPT